MKKGFDAVRFQREARAKLAEEYARDAEAFRRRLKQEFAHLRRRESAPR